MVNLSWQISKLIGLFLADAVVPSSQTSRFQPATNQISKGTAGFS